MRARPSVSIYLADGDDTTRAVTQTGGGGVNLWVGGICIIADNALLFHELAKVAALAAELQESVDEKKDKPHAFHISQSVEEAFRVAKLDPNRDTCQVCGRRRDDGIHEVDRAHSDR